MKTTVRLLPALAGLAAAAFAQAEPTARDSGRVVATEIRFFEPEKFTDVRDDSVGSEKGRAAILTQISEYLLARTRALLPDGWHLAVTFADIDLAGDFEPWHAEMRDIRIVKDIYPPRMKVEFKLTDADGAVVKEGKRELRDLMFLSRLMINRDDPLRHEKALLDDWLREDFPYKKGKRK